jgi:integrase
MFQPGPTTLAQAIKAFFEYPDYLGLAPNTIRNKRQALGFLVDAAPFRGDTPVGFLTYENFAKAMQISAEPGSEEENARRRMLKRAAKMPRSAQTQGQDRTTLSQFADFLVFRKWIDPTFNPLPRFARSTRANRGNDEIKPEPVVIREQDYDRLLNAAEKRHMRCRMTIAIGLWSGRRVSEAVRLKWGDLDLTPAREVEPDVWEGQEMTIRNVKRGRSATIPILDELMPELLKYKTWYESMYGPIQPQWFLLPARYMPKEEWPTSYYFFVDAEGQRQAKQVDSKFLKGRIKAEPSLWPMKLEQMCREESLNDDVANALADVGYVDPYRPGMHLLRHALAEWLHRIDPTGRLAQVLLDHDSLITTLKSYSVYGEQLQRAKQLIRDRRKAGPTSRTPAVTPQKPQQPQEPQQSQSELGQSEASNVVYGVKWGRAS